MKTVVIIVLAAIIVLGGTAVTGFYFGIFSLGQKTGSGQGATPPSPLLVNSPVPTATTPAAVRPTIPPTVTLPPVAPTIIPTAFPTAIPSPSVNFQITITNLTGTGLSRTVNAQITNDGTADAHNVWVKSEVFSQQQKIQLSGQDSLRVDIGTVKAGATTTSQVNLSFNLLDGLRIQQNGARFVLTVNSDERVQTLNYDYTP